MFLTYLCPFIQTNVGIVEITDIGKEIPSVLNDELPTPIDLPMLPVAHTSPRTEDPRTDVTTSERVIYTDEIRQKHSDIFEVKSQCDDFEVNLDTYDGVNV